MLHTRLVFTIVHATNFNHDFMIGWCFGCLSFFWGMGVCQNFHWKCTKFWPKPDSREVQEDLQNLHHPKRIKEAFLDGQVLWKYVWFQSARDRERQTSFSSSLSEYLFVPVPRLHHFPAFIVGDPKKQPYQEDNDFPMPDLWISYCWWFRNLVYQLRLVVVSHYLRGVFYIPGGFLPGFLNHQR